VDSGSFIDCHCAEPKQLDFRRGAAEASRGVKLRFALAQEGCTTACLDVEVLLVVDVWHGQSAHSSLHTKQQRVTDYSKLLELFLRLVLWKQIENDFFLLVLTALPVGHQLGKHCT